MADNLITMTDSKKKRKRNQDWLVPVVIGIILLGAIGFLIKVMITPDSHRSKSQISTVTLFKPPPPQLKEKLPEPEIQKEAPKQNIEQVIETPQNTPQDSAQQDDAPIGLDAEGSAGSDPFDLGSKKGGRDVKLGGASGTGSGSRLSQMAKYGWYTKKIQDEIRSQIKKRLDLNGGFPKGKYQTLVRIVLDTKGAIVDFRIVGPSGNDRMDSAIRETIGNVRLSEPPPEGMPPGMTIKISSQG